MEVLISLYYIFACLVNFLAICSTVKVLPISPLFIFTFLLLFLLTFYFFSLDGLVLGRFGTLQTEVEINAFREESSLRTEKSERFQSKREYSSSNNGSESIRSFSLSDDKLPLTFRLLRVQGLPAWANNSSVSIRDVIQVSRNTDSCLENFLSPSFSRFIDSILYRLFPHASRYSLVFFGF